MGIFEKVRFSLIETLLALLVFCPLKSESTSSDSVIGSILYLEKGASDQIGKHQGVEIPGLLVIRETE